MTRVEVLTGVPDPVVYACKFLRKTQASAEAQPVRHMVCGPIDVLKRLDAQLWSFDPHSFIAHAWAASTPAPAVRERTPIWLGSEPDPGLGCTVLVNLHEAATEGWQAFDRVVEFVGTQEDQVKAGRQRWKAYGQPGVERVHHAAAGTA